MFAILYLCRLVFILSCSVETQELLQNAITTAEASDTPDSTKEALQALVDLQLQPSPSGFQPEAETENSA